MKRLWSTLDDQSNSAYGVLTRAINWQVSSALARERTRDDSDHRFRITTANPLSTRCTPTRLSVSSLLHIWCGAASQLPASASIALYTIGRVMLAGGCIWSCLMLHQRASSVHCGVIAGTSAFCYPLGYLARAHSPYDLFCLFEPHFSSFPSSIFCFFIDVLHSLTPC